MTYLNRFSLIDNCENRRIFVIDTQHVNNCEYRKVHIKILIILKHWQANVY